MTCSYKHAYNHMLARQFITATPLPASGNNDNFKLTDNELCVEALLRQFINNYGLIGDKFDHMSTVHESFQRATGGMERKQTNPVFVEFMSRQANKKKRHTGGADTVANDTTTQMIQSRLEHAYGRQLVRAHVCDGQVLRTVRTNVQASTNVMRCTRNSTFITQFYWRVVNGAIYQFMPTDKTNMIWRKRATCACAKCARGKSGSGGVAEIRAPPADYVRLRTALAHLRGAFESQVRAHASLM
jgi:hypothetical protein